MEKNILACCREEKLEDRNYLWYYDNTLVMELYDFCFYAYSEPFRMRLVRFLRKNNIMFKEQFDEKKNPFYQITEKGLDRLILLSR